MYMVYFFSFKMVLVFVLIFLFFIFNNIVLKVWLFFKDLKRYFLELLMFFFICVIFIVRKVNFCFK